MRRAVVAETAEKRWGQPNKTVGQRSDNRKQHGHERTFGGSSKHETQSPHMHIMGSKLKRRDAKRETTPTVPKRTNTETPKLEF